MAITKEICIMPKKEREVENNENMRIINIYYTYVT